MGFEHLMPNSRYEPFAKLVHRLARNESFHRARFNDVEVLAILQGNVRAVHAEFYAAAVRNVRHHHGYPPAMCEEVRDCLRHPRPNIAYAVELNKPRGLRSVIRDWVTANSPIETFLKPGCFQEARGQPGAMSGFINQLRRRGAVFVAPAFVRAVADICYGDLIPVPPSDCWHAQRRVATEVLRRHRPGMVYVLSCNVLASTLIHNLWPFIGRESAMLDVGSLWEYYLGVRTRPAHARLKLSLADLTEEQKC